MRCYKTKGSKNGEDRPGEAYLIFKGLNKTVVDERPSLKTTRHIIGKMTAP